MDTRNENCFVRSSQHLLTIANPDVRELLMFVSEKDMDYVAVGQSVRLLLDRFPGQSFVGKVGEIYTEPTPQGDQVEPTETLKRFPVSVAIQEFPGQAVAGAVGRAKISVPSQSIGKRLWLLFERAKNTKL